MRWKAIRRETMFGQRQCKYLVEEIKLLATWISRVDEVFRRRCFGEDGAVGRRMFGQAMRCGCSGMNWGVASEQFRSVGCR